MIHYLKIERRPAGTQVEVYVACHNGFAMEIDQGATFHAFYHIPQGECCHKCTIVWQTDVENSGVVRG
jgi:hypothetical protein